MFSPCTASAHGRRFSLGKPSVGQRSCPAWPDRRRFSTLPPALLSGEAPRPGRPPSICKESREYMHKAKQQGRLVQEREELHKHTTVNWGRQAEAQRDVHNILCEGVELLFIFINYYRTVSILSSMRTSPKITVLYFEHLGDLRHEAIQILYLWREDISAYLWRSVRAPSIPRAWHFISFRSYYEATFLLSQPWATRDALSSHTVIGLEQWIIPTSAGMSTSDSVNPLRPTAC